MYPQTPPFTHFNRLVPGSSKNSHGHVVARQSGIPAMIVARAVEIKEKLMQCQAIEPLTGDSPQSTSRRQEYEAICRKFLQFDCERGDVRELMTDIFSLAAEE